VLRYRSSLLFLGIVALFALTWPSVTFGKQLQGSLSEQCNLTADELEVYSETIREVLLKDHDDTARVILRERTSDGYPPGMASMKAAEGDEKDLLQSISTQTRDDFDTQNKIPCTLGPQIQPVGKIQLLTSREERANYLGRSGSWNAFYKKYPGATGFTILSKIGFNSTHDQALVYLGNSCGLLCGNGYLVVLDKHKGKWKVVKQGRIWVAG